MVILIRFTALNLTFVFLNGFEMVIALNLTCVSLNGFEMVVYCNTASHIPLAV